jgi:acetolactate synthase-1/2/3 large subunit
MTPTGGKIRIADYLFKVLVEEYGVDTVFMISGGGAMHLNDAAGLMQEAGKLRYVCNHHEQACAIAAEGYSRAGRGRMGFVCVTTGPGGLNTLTGVMGQWTDSVPVLYISGQVKMETTLANAAVEGLRQVGDQEVDIISIVRPLTKYAVSLTDPVSAGKVLEEAVAAANEGRPGPVWIDIPVDVQGAVLDLAELERTRESTRAAIEKKAVSGRQVLSDSAEAGAVEVWRRLKGSRRPVIVAGRGVRISGARNSLLEFASMLKAPVLGTFNAMDLAPTSHECFAGRIGTVGDRAGNFALQNADLLIGVGTRNNIRQASYSWGNFARSAFKVMVDLDAAELAKPTVKPDLAINTDAGVFLDKLLLVAKRDTARPTFGEWLEWCTERKRRYPVVVDEYRIQEEVSPYLFVNELTGMLEGEDVVVAGNGTACVALFQAGISKERSTLFFNSGCASMGYDLPAAIGAWCSLKPSENGRRRVCCLAGDGSIMMNLQELETVAYNQIPLKIFVLNNGGYVSIRQTQNAMFAGHHVANGPGSGVGFPDFPSLAKGFGIKAARIRRREEIVPVLQQILEEPGPVLVDVVLNPALVFSPRVSSGRNRKGQISTKPLEDMWPFLSREELQENMLVDLLED